ncbi:CsbD family protein (plasmid) [Tistrella bauzanensis]|jgi:uncharacterized protein YjbJ (UPF0337 family)|uniref:CsbD family protein n=1 Tax=Tistrella arctica TaxID=3133430 RepID=A0ABU9YRG5_9PROT
MDKDRIEGGVREAKGKVKEVAGRVTGDRQTEAEGRGEKTAGKVQGEYGKAKDTVRDSLRK